MAEIKKIENHSDKQIYDGCIELMSKMMDNFAWYLDFIGVKIDDIPEDEKFSFGISKMEIVRTLFLQHTGHSGGTSTRAKCDELGIDWSESEYFDITDHVGWEP